MNNNTVFRKEIYLNETIKLEYFLYDTIDSTQLEGRRQRQSITLKNWKLWVANSQNFGIGQKGKKWASPKNVNLYATFGIKIIKLSNVHLNHIPLIIGLVLIKLFKIYNIDARLKLPNDIMISNRKIAGILTESFSKVEDVNGIKINKVSFLIGIGINVNILPNALKLDQLYTSMKIEKNNNFDREQIIIKLVNLLYYHFDNIQKFGSNLYLEEINKYIVKY